MHFFVSIVTVKELQEYLYDTFGNSTAMLAEKENSSRLPFYLRSNYSFYFGLLNGQKVIWAEVKNPASLTPDQLKKQSESLQEMLGNVPVVYVFDKLEPWFRNRLIEKKVGFAEPFRQLYIPHLYTQIRDGHRKVKGATEAGIHLKAPAQLFLLYHLQIQQLEGMPLQDIAGLLNYSAMSVSRIIKELSTHGLLRVEGNKEKSVIFDVNANALWEKALPLLTSPVREIWYTDNSLHYDNTLVGGETALAHYSMLAAPAEDTTVIGKDAFRIFKKEFGKLDRKYGFHKLEVWHYNPLLLSKGNEIDKLSLYLSLKDQEDERVQAALVKLINGIVWL